MPARAFEARAEATPDVDPITFTVSGRPFRCVPMAPASALEIVTGMPSLPGKASPGYQRAVIEWCTRMALFIRACIEPSEQAQWDALVGSTYIDPDVYADITTWLATEYAGRLAEAADPTPAPLPVEAHSGPDAGELDPITARQIEIDRRAGISHEPDPLEDLPDHLRALIEAGGGFTLPGQG